KQGITTETSGAWASRSAGESGGRVGASVLIDGAPREREARREPVGTAVITLQRAESGAAEGPRQRDEMLAACGSASSMTGSVPTRSAAASAGIAALPSGWQPRGTMSP